MKTKSLVATVSAFFLIGVLSGRGFAESAALDRLKAQAESLGAATAVPAETPAAVPVREADASGPRNAVKDVEGHVDQALGHFLYSLFPRLEPKGDRHLEIALNNMAVQYVTHFDKKQCPLDLPLGNLREIVPGVYRSGLPTQEGIAQLKQMGVKTVLSLLRPDETQKMSYPEAPAAADSGMSYANVPIDWTAWPTFQQIDQALAIVTDPSKQPVLIHCTCGSDRTGVVSAAYRIAIQGWTPEQAAGEAKAFYWIFPVFGDLTEFLSSYARYRAEMVPPRPAPAS